ncbi:MAG TPA: sigma-70 family RNA polymerase sigma factor [Verrucomicrobiae bacterium]|jgi:RNA polymerase sigma-70 factor (ECF subfamily)
MAIATNIIPLLMQEPALRQPVEAPFIQTTPPDADTIARQLSAAVARGDAAAFQQLYNRYHARLLRFALVFSRGSEMLAQDAVQSTFVTAAAKLRCVESDDHLWNWLARVARQQLTKLWQQQRQMAMVSLADLPDLQKISEPDSFLEKCLDTSLLALNEEEQRLVEWFYFDGLSHKQIAERLGITPKAVSSQLERTRTKLRSLIKRGLSHET